MNSPSPTPPARPVRTPTPRSRARRRHPAAATRILIAGLATSATLGIVGALALDEHVSAGASSSTSDVTTTSTLPPIVHHVYRYIPVPVDGGSPAATSVPVPSPRSTTPAIPAPRARPQPATRTRGS